MMVWLRPQCILAIVTSLYYYSQLVSAKTYDRFYCSTEEGHHQIACPDESALLTDVTIRKIYRRTQMCAPDVHSDYLVHCQGSMDGSSCEGNKTCSIEVSSRNYVQCGEKTYSPTYFFVKYTCTQIHMMCTDTAPLRNTLYGFIVSPAYPHPMADNLKCSISIEADPSMFIELAPIQLRLQEAMKCRSEYLEIFGYLNSPSSNGSSDDSQNDKSSKNMWKSYHTWCGTDRTNNHPALHTRYLISSNSLYMSLQTAVSKKSRYFKIRYKVVPASARSQYDPDGIAYDSPSGSSISSVMTISTSTTVLQTTLATPLVNDRHTKNGNGTSSKHTLRKEILIGIIAGVLVLILAILIGVGIFLFLKRRRRPAAANTPTKKPTSPTNSTTNNNPTTKPGAKLSDKAPLLEQTNTTTVITAAAATKRKLVPERTVQISDVNTSRFKSGAGTNSSVKGGTTGKDASSTSSEAIGNATATTTIPKQPLTAADSGIYGADLSEDTPAKSKIVPSTTNPPPVYGLDLPDKSEATATPTPLPSPAGAPTAVFVVVNPLSEQESTAKNVVPNHMKINALPGTIPEDQERSFQSETFDDTVRSAYSNMIDATISENEGTVSSASQSRRTSHVRQPLLSHETNMIDHNPRKATQFNPLHVILKKDANKYYTTEYI